MGVLLLRLSAPMQSWGVQSRFGVRDSGLEPSKSGVIGLIAAALGRPRSADIRDFANLRMGVRVDREGTLLRDYHTAQNVYLAKGGKPKDTELSTRYYLAGACFLVGLEGDDQEGDVDLLRTAQDALRNPRWALFLGRRAFPPGEPVWLADGLRPSETLEQALAAYPTLVANPESHVRLVVEDPAGSEVRSDQPLSFSSRRFLPRRIRTEYMDFAPQPIQEA